MLRGGKRSAAGVSVGRGQLLHDTRCRYAISNSLCSFALKCPQAHLVSPTAPSGVSACAVHVH